MDNMAGSEDRVIVIMMTRFKNIQRLHVEMGSRDGVEKETDSLLQSLKRAISQIHSENSSAF